MTVAIFLLQVEKKLSNYTSMFGLENRQRHVKYGKEGMTFFRNA